MENVTLIGGGLAGSVMAVYLAQRGMSVDLYERRPDLRNTKIPAGRSINLALSTRGLRALDKIGLKDAILSKAIPMKGRMMHSVDGTLTYQPYGKEGQHINSVSRAHLNLQLLELADENKSVNLHFSHRCLNVDLEKTSATFMDENGEKVETKGDFIIGADGAFSAVRSKMQKSGRFNYSQDYSESGYKELTIAPINGDFAMDPNSLHIWPRGGFMLIALPNPDKTFTCTLFMPYDGEPGFDHLNSDDEIMAFFETYFADVIPLAPELLTDFKENPVGSLVTIRCYPWVNNKSILLGDSAHAIVPFYGQGMNCAFEDCVILDECMEQHWPDWSKTFDAYQKERKPNADAIASLALQNFIEMRDLVGDEDFLLQKKMEHFISEEFPELFKSQYELVTFTNEPYSYAQKRGAENTQLVKKMIANSLHLDLENKNRIKEFINTHRVS
jgi:kynurenine 3-monooxygenase